MMMCTMKYGVFIFFGAWQTIALIFVILFLPETRGVPIEKVWLLLLMPPLAVTLQCEDICEFGLLADSPWMFETG